MSLQTKRRARTALRPEPAKEPEQGLDGPVLADPQQPPVAGVDLVDQGEVAVPAVPLNLIDAEGGDIAQVLMRAAPGHGHGHRVVDVGPAGVEDLGHRGPTQALGPPGQEPGVGGGELLLARRPRGSLPRGRHSAGTGPGAARRGRTPRGPRAAQTRSAARSACRRSGRAADSASTAGGSGGAGAGGRRGAGGPGRPRAGRPRTRSRAASESDSG